jgi:hypothetical protein
MRLLPGLDLIQAARVTINPVLAGTPLSTPSLRQRIGTRYGSGYDAHGMWCIRDVLNRDTVHFATGHGA